MTGINKIRKYRYISSTKELRDCREIGTDCNKRRQPPLKLQETIKSCGAIGHHLSCISRQTPDVPCPNDRCRSFAQLANN